MLGWASVVGVNWGHLFHAYGVALDTPGYLHGLTDEHPSKREAGVDHLQGAVLHQGTIYPATPPAVAVVAGLLGEEAVRAPLSEETDTHRAAIDRLFQAKQDECETLVTLLAWLADVGDSMSWTDVGDVSEPVDDADVAALYAAMADDDDEVWSSPLADTLMRNAVVELQAMASGVLAAIITLIHDPDAKVRAEAANAASQWAASMKAPVPPATVLAISAQLASVTGRDEKAAFALALGKSGGDVSGFLTDQDEAIRACAALFVNTPEATQILIASLTRPEQVDSWFQDKPAFFHARTRFTLLAEVIRRGGTIEQLLPAALALIGVSTGWLADYDWGPILQVAFPDAEFRPGVRPPLPNRLTRAQRQVIEALLANQSLWDEHNGNARLARMKVGLPDDPADVTAYLQSTPDTALPAG